MDTSIFRQVSLDRLSSPEQLDQMLQVTGMKAWTGLMSIFLLLAISMVWGCKGSIATTAKGQGVIVRKGGVLNVVTRGGGLIVNIDVKVGEKVRANQVLATIAQPSLAEKIRSLRQALAEAMQERERAQRVHMSSARLQSEALERQRSNAELQIGELEEQAKLITEQIAADEHLVAKGLITRQQGLATKQRLITVNDEIATLHAQIKQIDAQRFTIQSQPQEDDTQMRERISNLQRDIAGAESEKGIAENVVSPYGGEVLELKVYPGGTVSTDEPILSIQPDEQTLELIAYLPSSQAKDTKVGMEVQVSPSTIKREEYGYMKGDVVYVANYPATGAAIMRNFENESLAKVLTISGAVTEIHVALRTDRNTPSGFAWSTSKGPVIALSGGTICDVQIVTKRQKPITLAFPYLRDTLGMS